MKTLKNLLLTLVLTTTLLFLSPINVQAAQSTPEGKVVLGGFFTLESGKSLDGGLLVIGGQVVLEEDSVVNGDVLVFGGIITARGEINGSVTSIGATLNLEDPAVVNGDVNTVGSNLNKSDQAVINGSTTFDLPSDMDFNYLPALPFSSNEKPNVVNTGVNFKPVWDFMWSIFRAVALAAFAAVLSLFMQKPIDRVADSFMAQPFASGGLGLLTLIVAPALFVLLMITIILIPLGLIGFIALALAYLLGWIAAGYELGKRLEALFKQTWAPTISIGLGTLALTLLASLFNSIVCIGWVIPVLIGMIGLGGVILSRFGTATYSPKGPDNHPNPQQTAAVE
jgi:cytoskeletal protein CcmA (bactofilin family)